MYVNVFSSIKKNLYLNIQLRAQILKVVHNVYMWIFVVFPQNKKIFTVVHTSLSIWKLLSSTIFKVTGETIIHKGLVFMGNSLISFLTIDSTSLPSSFSRKDKLGNVTTEISISTKITVNGFELPTSFVSTQCLSY